MAIIGTVPKLTNLNPGDMVLIMTPEKKLSAQLEHFDGTSRENVIIGIFTLTSPDLGEGHFPPRVSLSIRDFEIDCEASIGKDGKIRLVISSAP